MMYAAQGLDRRGDRGGGKKDKKKRLIKEKADKGYQRRESTLVSQVANRQRTSGQWSGEGGAGSGER